MTFSSPFSTDQHLPPAISINPETEIIFVSDVFAEQYAGGAELTTEALIKRSPVPVQKIWSRDVNLDLLRQGSQKYWIFGNFASLDFNLIPTIVANINYSILEYDYKYCKYRSPEKHLFIEKEPCNCENTPHGKMISAFFFGAKSLWWMSEAQQKFYCNLFPFLSGQKNTVLSSVFDDEFFINIKHLREKNASKRTEKWSVMGSGSWIKGTDLAEEWCKKNGYDYEVVGNLPYEKALERLAQSTGFVYLPKGMDTCPRMVIEAKLLGCQLHLNNDVQHANEEWFNTDNIQEIEEYLYASRDLFWRHIMDDANHQVSISGYTTTRNCIEQGYPWKDCIGSLLSFCSEVIVVDGGSTDGTWEELLAWSEKEEKIRPTQVLRDWDHKRFAVFDGAQKAEARSRCTGDFCWQIDADEVVPENDASKIVKLCQSWPRMTDLVSLPVIEYWGCEDKVRIDVNPWKWRISKNLPHITHGIPSQLRKYDSDGDVYASAGTDGCDYIHTETGMPIPYGNFYNEQAHNARAHALQGNQTALSEYEAWLQNCVNLLPGVKHYSWMNLERKIRTYKNYWQSHWESLYNIKQEDTAENNMFFDKPWAEVTDEEISEIAKRLATETGGHIFHEKINWSRPTPSIKITHE